MAEITLLDGGIGQELLTRTGDTPARFWATQVMLDHPGLLREIHEDYFAAGASLATSNTYALHRDRFEGSDLAERYTELIDMAVAEAKAARLTHGRGLLAGSVGPLVESYRPDLHPPHDQAVASYAEVAERIGPHVDLILCETVASIAHARAVLEGVAEAGKPVWLSVTVADDDGTRLRSGEPVAEVLTVADRAAALLANCSAPEAMDAALGVLASGGRPFGAYANGFANLTQNIVAGRYSDTELEKRDITPEKYTAFALGWIGSGATIVGGCCEIGPAHIRHLAAALKNAGHSIA